MIEQLPPALKALAPFIERISIFRSQPDQTIFKILPDIRTSLCFLSNSTADFSDNTKLCVRKCTTSSLKVYLPSCQTVQVEIDGHVNAILIEFKPLGINHFLNEPLGNFAARHHSVFVPFFKSHVEEKQWVDNLLSADDPYEQSSMMECLLLQLYRPYYNRTVQEALIYLMDMEANFTIPQICRKIGTSPRTLNRLFHEHLCISPIQLKNINQFRQSLSYHHQQCGNFYQLALESNYTDHPYLVKVYKKYTGLSPTNLFYKTGDFPFDFNIDALAHTSFLINAGTSKAPSEGSHKRL